MTVLKTSNRPASWLVAGCLLSAPFTACTSSSESTDPSSPAGGHSSTSGGGTAGAGPVEASGGHSSTGEGGTAGAETVEASGGRANPPGGVLNWAPVTVLSFRVEDAAAGASGWDDSDWLVDSIEPTASACTTEWEDFGCDGEFPLFPPEDNCEGALRIDYSRDQACPVCVAAPEAEPTCADVRRRYLEFMDHNLRETCSNWCESDDDCFAHPLTACGLRHVLALYGAVDEEPIGFSEAFDVDNCEVCPESPEDSPPESGPPVRAACEQHQCVLVPLGK